MAQVKFLKPVSPYNEGEIADVSPSAANDFVKAGVAEAYELAVEEKKTAKKAESTKVE